MRSRPDLTVYLTPSAPVSGAELHIHVRLHSHSRTPFDAIDVVLTGKEVRYKHPVRAGNPGLVPRYERQILALGRRFPAGVLEPGDWDREVIVPLPPEAPPSYRSKLTVIAYTLDVRVHIPWWPDREGQYAITVRPPAARQTAAAPALYTTQKGENRGAEPVLELSVDNGEVAQGGVLSGAVALSGLGDRHIRRIELACSTVESAFVFEKSAGGSLEVDRRSLTIHQGTPRDGEPVPFRLGIPEDLPTSFTTPVIRVQHVLEATAVVAFGTDLVLRAPVVVLRSQAPREELEPRSPKPLLGRARHIAVWRAAAEGARSTGLHELSIDADNAAASFQLGGIEVSVAEEHREGLGPCLAAHLEWASLGLDLRLAERRWTDFGGNLEGIDARFQKRFTLRAREPAQAATVLDKGVREALVGFDEAGLDDASAAVLRKGGVYQVKGLERFFALSQALAAALGRAVKNVPPPAAFASVHRAWQRFAEEQGASLRVGDLSLHGWFVHGVAISLVHEWEADRPVRSRLCTALPADAVAEAWTETVSQATQQPCAINNAELYIPLPTVTEPDTTVALATRFARACAKLRGSGDAGPYR